MHDETSRVWEVTIPEDVLRQWHRQLERDMKELPAKLRAMRERMSLKRTPLYCAISAALNYIKENGQ